MSALEHHLQDQLSKKEEFDDFFWHRIRWNAVKSIFPKNRKFQVLDVGAGTGQAGRYLSKDFPMGTYNFIEPLASLNKELRVMYDSSRDFSEKNSYGDINYLICLDVLEHIEDDHAFVRKTLLNAPSGTRMVFTVPAMEALWSPWDKAMGHFRRYNKQSLRALFNLPNCRINRTHYLFPEMVPVAVLRKIRMEGSDESDGEFPSIPSWLNQIFYFMGNLTRLFGFFNPFGSSLLIEVTKK